MAMTPYEYDRPISNNRAFFTRLATNWQMMNRRDYLLSDIRIFFYCGNGYMFDEFSLECNNVNDILVYLSFLCIEWI